MITDVGKFKAINSNYQVQCPNLKFKGTTNYANCTNHLAISIRAIRAIRSRSIFVVLIIKFKVQISMFKGQEVQIIKFKVQTSMFKGHRLCLWWSLTFMLGEEAAAVSIEEFFEGFNLQTEFCTLVGVLNA